MDDLTIGIVAIAALFGLVLAGVHIAFSLLITSVVALVLITGSFDIAMNLLASTAYSGVRDYLFAVVPLFILMGAFMTNCRAAEALYTAVNLGFKRVRGGLAVATVYANAVFSAVTGVSVASAAVFSTIAYPQMDRFGYSRRLALGSVAGSSVLGMLIPPSLLMILYGILTQTSIGDLFIAGVIPGILLAVLYSIGIVIMGYLRPTLVGADAGAAERIAARERQHELIAAGDGSAGGPAATRDLRQEGVAAETLEGARGGDELPVWKALAGALPILGLVVLVIGGIWGGLFSPTEASAVGVVGALIIAPFMGMDWRKFLASFTQTAVSTGAILFLLIAAQLYSRMLATSGMIGEVGSYIAQLEISEILIILLFVLILVVMGAILDSSSIILLAVPLMFPSIQILGADPIWFGIVLIVAVEIGLLTPPFGMVPFAMSAVLGKRASVDDIFIGSLPFLVIMALFLGLLIAFPALSTWLPSVL